MIKYILIFSILLFSCKGERQSLDVTCRPSLHLSAERNWMGEPTGLVYYEGKYHIFYQYNQNGSYFGDISWGHAVSNDLIHWEQLPIALPIDSTRQVDSGSVIVDVENSSEFSTTNVPPFIAFYSKKKFLGNEEKVMIYASFSLDKGVTWEEYQSPVLELSDDQTLQFPKVKWNKFLNQWLMTVSTGNSLLFYTSQNCKAWHYHSKFEFPDNFGGWESSDFFSLTDEITQEEKWVLLLSMNNGPTGDSPATRYFVGDFDASGFHPTQPDYLWTDYGRDHYAAMTFNNTQDDRTILLAWMNCWNYANLLPTTTWKGSLSIPREVHLGFDNNRVYLLVSSPVKELNDVWKKEESVIKDIEFSDEYHWINNKKLNLPCELNLSFNVAGKTLLFAPAKYGLRFKKQSGNFLELGYDGQDQYFYIDPSGLREGEFVDKFEELVGASYRLKNDTVNWKILLDKNSIEFFGAGGKAVLSSLQFSSDPFVDVELFSKAGKTRLIDASIRSY